MRRRGHTRRHSEDGHGIDLAPMLDFVMNLLIFFIITAVFVKEMGVTVNRAGGATSDGGGAPSIVVSVMPQGEIWIDGRVVDLRAVRANIEKMRAVSPKSGVLVAADQDATAGLLVELVDQVHLAGVYDVTFGTN
jgi:biopolymer transport protein ExbD